MVEPGCTLLIFRRMSLKVSGTFSPPRFMVYDTPGAVISFTMVFSLLHFGHDWVVG